MKQYFQMLLIFFVLYLKSNHFCAVDVKQKIGRRIKELREEAKMSQKDSAYAADLDRSYIANIEKGGRNISIVNIEKIAIALNVTLKDFFSSPEFNKHKGDK